MAAEWIKLDRHVIHGGDLRVKRLQRALNATRAETLLVLVLVWDALYFDAEGGAMTAEEIDLAAERDGVAVQLVACGLAEETPDGLVIAGAERAQGMARYRDAKKKNGSRPKKRIGDDQSEAKAKRDGSESEAKAKRPYSYSLSDSSSSLFPDLPEATKTVEASTPREDPAPGPQRQVTDHFAARFLARTGSRPTWGHARGKLFRDLRPILEALGPDELCRRIDVLFDAPPRFLAGSVPDFATLLQHVDKLAAPAQTPIRGSPGALSPDDLGRLAEEARRRGF